MMASDDRMLLLRLVVIKGTPALFATATGCILYGGLKYALY